ncbi:MAG: ubiquinol-cytochrome c reductase cytochrome b subunit [Actinomycetota bacterium]|nr:ubiquinol-cytochrome c reductase cytochrome b subunit [Actinomycetota bacterium]
MTGEHGIDQGAERGIEHGDEHGAGVVARWVDDRLRVSKFADSVLNHVFPDNWSFLLGEIAMYCFVILVLTGVFLTFFFHAGSRDVVYSGSYGPLRGVHMSEAYDSTISLSFDVRAGLVVRQIHHWTALVFAAAVVAHLCRIFFTGAFRRPREINWIIGVTMLILVIFNGFAGYSLPDDLLSATGLRIGYSILLSIPFVGTWIASLFFGGPYPGTAVIGRLFIIHVLILPALIAVLLSIHLAIVWRQKHTQFPGAGRTEHNVTGLRLWPTYAAKSAGLFAGVVAVVSALGGLAQINPLWLYGPYRTGAVTTAAQPDWYMGWLEGSLRLFPAWRVHLFGHTISELFWPGVVVPGLTFALLYAWPFIEARVTHDRTDHELLDRPRTRPGRTAIGAGVLTFYLVLMGAGSQDIFAQHLDAPITTVNRTFQVLLFVAPIVVALLTWKLCRDLTARPPDDSEEPEPELEPGTPPELELEPARGAPPRG